MILDAVKPPMTVCILRATLQNNKAARQRESASRSGSPETAEKSAENNKCLAALLFWNVAREIQTVIGGLNSKAVCGS